MAIGILLGITGTADLRLAGMLGTVICECLKSNCTFTRIFIVMSALAQHKEGHETNMKSIVIFILIWDLRQLSLE